MVQPLWKTVLRFLRKLEVEPYDPESLFWVCISEIFKLLNK